jgi:hypothetical protein
MLRNRRILLVLLALAPEACSLDTDPGTFGQRQPAIIDHGGADSVIITLPSTAIVGTAISVVVTTYGGDCVHQGDTQASVAGLIAEVRPFDVFQANASSSACTRNLVLYAHSATLTFLETGKATIRVFGRRDPGSVNITVERTVDVH